MLSQPHPVGRFGAGAIAALGALICADVLLLSVGFMVVAVLSCIGGVGRPFLRFLTVLMLPFALTLSAVWVGLMGAPPGLPMGTNRLAALQYVALIVLRLAVCSGLLQVMLLSIAPEALFPTLRGLRLPDELIVMVLSTFAVLPELKLRTDQVLTARLARGLWGRGGLPSRVLQLPHLLGPLVSWTLRSALQRAEVWEHRGLIGRLHSLPVKAPYSALSASLLLVMASAFLGLAIRTRLP